VDDENNEEGNKVINKLESLLEEGHDMSAWVYEQSGILMRSLNTGESKRCVTRIRKGNYVLELGAAQITYNMVGANFKAGIMLENEIRIIHITGHIYLTLADIVEMKDGQVFDPTGKTTIIEVRDEPIPTLVGSMRAISSLWTRSLLWRGQLFDVSSGESHGYHDVHDWFRWCAHIPGGIIRYSNTERLQIGVPDSELDMCTDYIALAEDEISLFRSHERTIMDLAAERMRRMKRPANPNRILRFF